LSPKSKPKLPIAVYTRVSEQGDRSDEALRSHEIQRGKVEKYLEAHDLVASPEVFEDTNRSGGKMSRPEFNRALKGVRDRRYGGIAVYHLSRFGRNTVGVLSLVSEFEELGATLVCLDPKIDTSDATGRAMLTVFLAFYTLEREQQVEKAADTAELKLAEGRTTGGAAAPGYQYEILGTDSNGAPILGWLVPSAAAPLVSEAFERFAARSLPTPGRVADFLNERGVKTSRGRAWNAQNVRGLLTRRTYLGIRSYGDDEFPDAHDPLVSEAVFNRVQRRLAPKTTLTRTTGEGHVLGGGLVRCGKPGCDHGLSRGLANGTYPTLRCNERGGGHAGISYAIIQEWVEGLAFAHAGVSMLHQGGNAAQVEAADAALEAALEDLQAIETALGAKAPTNSKQRLAVEEAQATRDALDDDDGSFRLLFAAGRREQYQALSIPEKRAALASLIERVELKPGRGTPSERVTIYFTDGDVHPAPDGTGAPVEVAA